MYRLCKTEQSARRQRLLEEGLMTAMHSMRYEDISISDLCQQMNIPRKSFYRYFSSKEGALHGLIDHTLMEYEGFGESYGSGEPRSLQRDLERFFLFWVRHRSVLDALSRSGLQSVLTDRAISYATSDMAFPGRFLPGETREMQNHVIIFGVCGLMTMMLQWHSNGCRESVQDMAKVAVRLLTQPLFPVSERLL
ncbi:MAG: TetR/AcrR family transcriptional regulator [Oscillospiraceae bacterium]|nr:TetR/AcrR family transcriptional regulator [Oscillospiraceae bacterium]